ncbi:hypothetical protein BRD00_14890 [Halobacteriales archaeon QS_8_69_26]|nr:MAG: hypothetical protein BRD00_14890 [Halobacteriales archaeon QS_8_69_26]
MQFTYPCPGCRSTNNLHDPDCRFAGRPHHEVEKAYADLLSVLSGGPMDQDELRAAVRDRFGAWEDLHVRALQSLESEYRVEVEEGHAIEDPEAGLIEMVPPEQRRDELRVPDRDPLRTIYEKGSVPGSHDNAVFAMVAYYEMVGFSWPETRELVVDWLQESGTWGRGGFEEASPEELVDSKRHVFETGYGWKEKAEAAKSVIDRNL